MKFATVLKALRLAPKSESSDASRPKPTRSYGLRVNPLAKRPTSLPNATSNDSAGITTQSTAAGSTPPFTAALTSNASSSALPTPASTTSIAPLEDESIESSIAIGFVNDRTDSTPNETKADKFDLAATLSHNGVDVELKDATCTMVLSQSVCPASPAMSYVSVMASPNMCNVRPLLFDCRSPSLRCEDPVLDALELGLSPMFNDIAAFSAPDGGKIILEDDEEDVGAAQNIAIDGEEQRQSEIKAEVVKPFRLQSAFMSKVDKHPPVNAIIFRKGEQPQVITAEPCDSPRELYMQFVRFWCITRIVLYGAWIVCSTLSCYGVESPKRRAVRQRGLEFDAVMVQENTRFIAVTTFHKALPSIALALACLVSVFLVRDMFVRLVCI